MMFMRRAGVALLLSAAALASSSPALSTETIESIEQPVILPFIPIMPDVMPDLLKLSSDVADRMTMPVEIQGVGPYPFIIDTGSHRSIVATELAERLALQELPPVEIVSMAGREMVNSVHLDEIRFGTQTVSDLPALRIDRSDLGSAGLIGLDGLKDKRLTLDFKRREIAIGKSTPVTELSREADTIVVRARSRLGQLILVNSKMDGRRVNVILDTGAEISVGNMALFDKLRQKRLVVPPRTVTITSVTGQAIEAQFTVVRELQIDSVTLNNVPMVFLDAAPFDELDLHDKPSMLLGMKMLRMFDQVAIDFGTRHIDFRLPQSKSRAEELRRQLAAL